MFVLRKTLTEVAERGSLDEKTRKLFVEGIEVAMVYFRCGYSPDQGSCRRIGHFHVSGSDFPNEDLIKSALSR